MSGSTPKVTPSLRLVTVFASTRVTGMYLYVDRNKGLELVPEALQERFGAAREVMTLPLTKQRLLTRADPERVLAAIADQGYFLQLPPAQGIDELGLPHPGLDMQDQPRGSRHDG